MRADVQPRRTRQRAAVSEALAASAGFLTAQDVHAALQAGGATVALATVYRTLQSMVETGEADTIRTPDGQIAYRQCAHGTGHHHHLVCRRCGRTVEIEFAGFERLVGDVARLHGFTGVAHELELFGECAACSQDAADPGPGGAGAAGASAGVGR